MCRNAHKVAITCGERACPRWSAQRSRFCGGRCAAQREQARSPQKRAHDKGAEGALTWCTRNLNFIHARFF
ncbi:hypothetical protein E3O56_19265 [Pseudomonas sp. W2Aug9]|nr:hypothetical protein [Pseudomonas sp. W2Aug9]